MKFKVPILGEFVIGRDVIDVPAPAPVNAMDNKTVKNIVDSKEKLTVSTLGGLIDFGGQALSNEKSVSTKLLQANKDWVYRNNDVIAQEVSSIELELFQVGLSKGEIVYRQIFDHPLLTLLDKFNDTTTKSDGIYTTQTHRKLTGDAFWYTPLNGKIPTAIHIISPDKVTLDIGDVGRGEPMVKGYLYKDTIDGKEIKIEYRPEEIIQFKKPNPRNQFRGLGVVEAIADTIDTDVLVNLTQMNFFKNGAITNFVLTTEGKLTDEQLKKFKAELKANNGGARKAFEAMILSGGLKPANISFSNRDLQLNDLLAWYRDKIMVGFGNTPASIGVIEDVNQANAEATLASWKRTTVKPDMDAFVGTLNEFLVPKFGDNLVLGYVNPVPEDKTDDIAEAVQLKQSGIITLNEARELVGYDTVPQGDEFQTPAVAPNPAEQDDQEQEDEQKKVRKRVLRKITSKKDTTPESLKHIDIPSLLRKRNIYSKQKYHNDLVNVVKPIAKKMLEERKKSGAKALKEATDDVTVERISPYFSNEVIMEFYEKQISTVASVEEQFHNAISKFIGKLEKQALENFDNELSMKTVKQITNAIKKETFNLFNDEDIKLDAQVDLTPILMSQVTVAGQQAYKLIGIDKPYIPYDVAKTVAQNVAKFTQSMIDTDRETLSKLITDGVTDGLGVPQIRDSIIAKFDEIEKNQANVITRSEVMRASNMGNLDAYEQSGIVEGKQWLSAGATDECKDYEGKVEKLRGGFYDSTNEFQDGDPPLHPNCRCVIIPVVDTDSDYSQPSKTDVNNFQDDQVIDE